MTNLIVVNILQYICDVYQIITLYTLNLHDTICQLHLSKAIKQLKDSKFEDRTIEIIQSELNKEKI